MREIAHKLATLGFIKSQKGEALNVRRREKVRRAIAEAGDTLGWAEVIATSEDPVQVARDDLRKMVRGGVRSLEREIAEELAAKEAEAQQLESVVEAVQELAESPDTEYPAEITYSRTAKDSSRGLVTKTETLSVADPKEALAAAQKMQRSLPRWDKLRVEMLDELHRREQGLATMRRNLSDLVDSWSRLLREVLVTVQ